MTLCPIAIAVGCKKCPAVSFCPVKGTLGDYKAGDETTAPSKPAASASAAKKNKS